MENIRRDVVAEIIANQQLTAIERADLVDALYCPKIKKQSKRLSIIQICIWLLGIIAIVYYYLYIYRKFNGNYHNNQYNGVRQ